MDGLRWGVTAPYIRTTELERLGSTPKDSGAAGLLGSGHWTAAPCHSSDSASRVWTVPAPSPSFCVPGALTASCLPSRLISKQAMAVPGSDHLDPYCFSFSFLPFCHFVLFCFYLKVFKSKTQRGEVWKFKAGIFARQSAMFRAWCARGGK